MSQLVIIHCSDDSCVHNSNGGYYGICKHPACQNMTPYAGIDRIYQSSCKSREVRVRDDLSKLNQED